MSVVSKPLGLAIVGVNNQGIDHLEAISDCEFVNLVALCDRSEELLEQTVSDFELDDVHLDTDLEQTVARSEVDAIIVALPHHLHPWAVDKAVQAGKHLLKEKPLARNLAEAHRLAGRVRDAGLVMHTGVQRRHHSTYEYLAEELEGQRVRSASVEITIAVKSSSESAERPLTWRDDFEKAGGGVLIDLGYHGIDLMHFLLGPMEVVSCVTMQDGVPCPAQTIDDDAYVWAVAGPAWVHMHYGRSDTKTERITIDTERGRYIADREEVRFRVPDGAEEVLHTADRSWAQTMVEQFETLYRAVEAKQVGTNDLPEQIPTIRFIEQCYGTRQGQGFSARGVIR